VWLSCKDKQKSTKPDVRRGLAVEGDRQEELEPMISFNYVNKNVST
jgi:hypothetical protein